MTNLTWQTYRRTIKTTGERIIPVAVLFPVYRRVFCWQFQSSSEQLRSVVTKVPRYFGSTELLI